MILNRDQATTLLVRNETQAIRPENTKLIENALAVRMISIHFLSRSHR